MLCIGCKTYIVSEYSLTCFYLFHSMSDRLGNLWYHIPLISLSNLHQSVYYHPFATRARTNWTYLHQSNHILFPFSGPISTFLLWDMHFQYSIIYLSFLSLRYECVLDIFLVSVEEYNGFVYFQASGGFNSLLLPPIANICMGPSQIPLFKLFVDTNIRCESLGSVHPYAFSLTVTIPSKSVPCYIKYFTFESPKWVHTDPYYPTLYPFILISSVRLQPQRGV